MNRNLPNFESVILQDDGTFPNNASLPLVLLQHAFSGQTALDPQFVEDCFFENGWQSSWRNGLYGYNHYHSTAHEVLGVYSGWVNALFGGPNGKLFTVRAGDVIIVPAGVVHKNVGQSSDFKVVGAYPKGQTWDMKYGKPNERPEADENIKRVKLPSADPVYGKSGLLFDLWQLS